MVCALGALLCAMGLVMCVMHGWVVLLWVCGVRGAPNAVGVACWLMVASVWACETVYTCGCDCRCWCADCCVGGCVSGGVCVLSALVGV